MTRLEQRKSGLVVPEQPPEPPAETIESPLEFQLHCDRVSAREAFSTLINLTRAGSLLSDELTPVRRELVLNLRKLLVGDQVEYMELT